MPGYEVFSRVIFLVFHHTAYRIAVNMHISRAHKYRHLYTLVAKIFAFVHFLNDHNPAISRCYDLVIAGDKIAVRQPEEISKCPEDEKRNSRSNVINDNIVKNQGCR